MPTHTVNPTARDNPDSGQGGTSAVTTDSNTGHASTVTSASASGSAPFGSDSDSETKSCRWHTFTSVSGTITSLRLKLSWNAVGNEAESPGDGTANAIASFGIEYSTNGGGAWTLVVADSGIFSNVDDADIDITGAAISQVQVRCSYSATTDATAGENEGATADADVTATISDIRLEVVTAGETQHGVSGMM